MHRVNISTYALTTFDSFSWMSIVTRLHTWFNIVSALSQVIIVLYYSNLKCWYLHLLGLLLGKKNNGSGLIGADLLALVQGGHLKQ